MKIHKTALLSLVLMFLLTLGGGMASAAPPDNRPPNNRPPSGGPPDNRPPDNRPPGKGGGGPAQEVCGDGLDNDNDGLVDEGCPPPPPIEICGDGLDNDGDGLVDEGCPPPPPIEVCGDGLDNDNDGLVDEDCAPPDPIEVCGDGIDNDGNGFVDEQCDLAGVDLQVNKLASVDPGGYVLWDIVVGNTRQDPAVIPAGTVLANDYLPGNVSLVDVQTPPGYRCDVFGGGSIVTCTALVDDVLPTFNGVVDTVRWFSIITTAPASPTTVANTVGIDPDNVIPEAVEDNNVDTGYATVE